MKYHCYIRITNNYNLQNRLIMSIAANNPDLKSWLEVAKDSDFPIQNIPFGVFSVEEDELVIGSRIGHYAISLTALNDLGYFKNIDFDRSEEHTSELQS